MVFRHVALEGEGVMIPEAFEVPPKQRPRVCFSRAWDVPRFWFVEMGGGRKAVFVHIVEVYFKWDKGKSAEVETRPEPESKAGWLLTWRVEAVGVRGPHLTSTS